MQNGYIVEQVVWLQQIWRLDDFKQRLSEKLLLGLMLIMSVSLAFSNVPSTSCEFNQCIYS